MPGAAEAGEATFDATAYLQLVLNQWRIIAVIAALALAAAFVQFLITPEQYRAFTTIQIEQRKIFSFSNSVNPWLEAWASVKYYPTQYRLLRSRGLAERVVLNLRLLDDPEFNPNRRQSGATGDSMAPVTADADALEIARLANRLLGGLSIEPDKSTELTEVSYISHSPQLAARIANGIADAFIDWGIETRTETVGKASNFLTNQIETLKLEIDDKERELKQYGRNTDIVNLDPSANLTLQQLDRLNQDLVGALGDRLEKEAQYNELVSSPKETVANRASQGFVDQLRQEQAKLEAEYESNLQTYKPDWPEMVQLKARIDEGRRNLESVIEQNASQAIKAAYSDSQTARRREAALADEIRRVKSEAMDQEVAAIEFKNLEMEIGNRRDLLDNLLQRLAEAGVSARLQTTRESNVRIVDRALVPGGPFRPSLRKNLTFGLGIGLALGIGVVLLIHLLDRTVKTAEELERLVRLPVLSVIPDVSAGSNGYGYYSSYGSGRRRSARRQLTSKLAFPRARKEGSTSEVAATKEIELLPEKHPRMAASEAYRSLRTALMLSSANELKVIGISSAEAGEGKSATSSNLALVMAQMGRKVLLVDADLRKSRQHRIFGVSNRTGLVNFITGSAELEQIILPTAIPNLAICPAGPHPPNPSELLASDRMRYFVEQVRKKFDFVIVDTPPVLVVTDALLAGNLVDGMALCFRAGKILRADAVACTDRLRLSGIRILGTILNGYRPGRGGYYAKKYYYYEAYEESAELQATDSAA